jgi:hypothetical protein
MAKTENNPIFGKRSARHFLHYVKGKCRKHGIELILREVSYLKLDGNIRCSGYFDDEGGKLVVAMKSPLALEILVHEFGHLTQYVDNCKPWRNLGNSLDKMTDWLQGKDIRNSDKYINVAREMELDNEKRSVQIIKDFNLNIDIDSYIQKANSYVYFYNWMKTTRRWSSSSNSPYKNQRLIEVMPKTFQKSYRTIPKHIAKVFKEQNI